MSNSAEVIISFMGVDETNGLSSSSIPDMPDDYNMLRFTICTSIQLICLISILVALIFTLAKPNWINETFLDVEFWIWEAMIVVVIFTKLISALVFQIIVFFIERSLYLRKRVLYFAYDSKASVQNCIWSGLIFIVWQCFIVTELERMTHGKKFFSIVTKIWVCSLVVTIIWLLYSLSVKVLVSNFHISKYSDQIQASLFNQYVIRTLSVAAPVIVIQQEQELNLEEGDMFTGSESSRTLRSSVAVADSGITIELSSQMMTQENIPAWIMIEMMKIITRTSVLATSDDAFMRIRSEKNAEDAAKKIFFKVAKESSDHIDHEDLMRFLGDDKALNKLRLFDGASRISQQALKNWVVNVFRKRRALVLSLEDMKTILDKLRLWLNVIVVFVIIVICVLILEPGTTKFFICLFSVLAVSATIWFGGTCKTIFEDLEFLLVRHPFDYGDLCKIDDVEMTVEKMNILTTEFLGRDNEIIVYPNIDLSTKHITNYHRSPPMRENISFCIHVSTCKPKFAEMKAGINSYVRNKSDHWQNKPEMPNRGVKDAKHDMLLLVRHRMNFQDMGERLKRRALLIEEMIKIFNDLGIEYSMDNIVDSLPSVTSNRVPSNWVKTC